MLQKTELDTLQTEFETFGRLPSETNNQLFVKSSVELIEKKLDQDIDQALLDANASLKTAIFSLSLFLYNARDFVKPLDQKTINTHVDQLCSPLTNLAKYVPEDSNA